MWVPHKELKKKKIKKEEIERDGERRREKWEGEFFLIFFLYYFHSQILKFPTVGFRRDKHGKCSKRRGLRVSTKNMRFHREFR